LARRLLLIRDVTGSKGPHERTAAMKLSALTVGFGTCLLTFACATSDVRPPQTASLAYTGSDIARIMHLRDDGQGLAEVARQVGGTRADVRAAERRELARRRAPRPEVTPDPAGSEPDRLKLSTNGSTSLENELVLVGSGFAVSW
jgi:hypothetical protein